ncbi:circadian clock-controlled protein daywake-like [Culicoides brevitarsis]|uniref:circadian clock-controlled protein daywake-like n=1 Tax=Culicoides brevitarsis TaxID=469753 RepID=UPI00307C4C54
MPSKERNECIKNSVNELLPSIIHGYDPLGIPDLDPYSVGIERFSVGEGILSVKILIEDSKTLGISTANVTNVKSKITKDNFGVILDVDFSKMTAEGNYKGDTRVNDFSFKSKGFFTLNIFKPKFKLKFLGKIKPTNGQNFVDIHTIKIMDTQVEDLNVDFTGLVAEPVVNQFALEFINQNWRNFYQQLVPRAVVSWEPIYLSVAKKFFDNIPLDELMPE